MESKDIEQMKDIKDAIDKIKKLQDQIENPSYDEMIKVLYEAKSIAPVEIMETELMQGDTRLMTWDQFSYSDLYRKLEQYQIGLRAYCISKIGKYAFEKLMNGQENK